MLWNVCVWATLCCVATVNLRSKNLTAVREVRRTMCKPHLPAATPQRRQSKGAVESAWDYIVVPWRRHAKFRAYSVFIAVTDASRSHWESHERSLQNDAKRARIMTVNTTVMSELCMSACKHTGCLRLKSFWRSFWFGDRSRGRTPVETNQHSHA